MQGGGPGVVRKARLLPSQNLGLNELDLRSAAAARIVLREGNVAPAEGAECEVHGADGPDLFADGYEALGDRHQAHGAQEAGLPERHLAPWPRRRSGDGNVCATISIRDGELTISHKSIGPGVRDLDV